MSATANPRTDDHAPIVGKTIEAVLLGVAAAGARPHQKRFALERLAKIRDGLRQVATMAGPDNTNAVCAILGDIEYVENMVRGIQ